jgi:hypothetical protein
MPQDLACPGFGGSVDTFFVHVDGSPQNISSSYSVRWVHSVEATTTVGHQNKPIGKPLLDYWHPRIHWRSVRLLRFAEVAQFQRINPPALVTLEASQCLCP